ncbi:MAG: hypothetical protein JST93_12925 [Acidobacteria bacterium]|nr:hypothetical protein [Acidobacteriota bacterium]
MIDKLFFQLPADVRFEAGFEAHVRDVLRRLPAGARTRPFKMGSALPITCHFYEPFFSSRDRATSVGQIQWEGTAGMSASTMRNLAKKIFADPAVIPIQRVDFAVDVPLVDVEWFHRNTRIYNARRTAEHATRHNRKGIATVEWGAGKSNRQYVVYDKVEERRQKGITLPDAPQILTRVECRLRKGEIPKSMSILDRLLDTVEDFSPFPEHRFMLPPAPQSPDAVGRLADLGLDEEIKLRGLLALRSQKGLHGVRSFIRKRGGKPERYENLLRIAATTDVIIHADLNGLFRASVCGQLEGSPITTTQAGQFVRTEEPSKHLSDGSSHFDLLYRFLTTERPQRVPASNTLRNRKYRKPPLAAERHAS